jgi:hypothetical protein
MTSTPIPAPREDDTEDVNWALTTAASLQQRGDHNEALRWLRRAVAAAVASAQDARAIELGRHAAELEDLLGAASTHRGIARDTDPDMRMAGLQRTLPLLRPIDGLDDPTYVDPPADVARITDVPFTKRAVGVTISDPAPDTEDDVLAHDSGKSGPPGQRRPALLLDDERTLQGINVQALAANLNVAADDITADTDAVAAVVAPTTQPNAERPEPTRVALLASSDGIDPRVIVLAEGASAPDGAAVALLTPATAGDAERIAHLFALANRPRSKR